MRERQEEYEQASLQHKRSLCGLEKAIRERADAATQARCWQTMEATKEARRLAWVTYARAEDASFREAEEMLALMDSEHNELAMLEYEQEHA